MDRKAKIVATIGPASQDETVLEKLLLAGMDVARLNFSHGTHETHAAWNSRLRAVSMRLGRPLAVLQDLQGPKIRVGVLPAPLTLVPGPDGHPFPGRRQPAVHYRQPGAYPRGFPAIVRFGQARATASCSTMGAWRCPSFRCGKNRLSQR